MTSPLAYRETPAVSPNVQRSPVLFLHGFTGCAEVWEDAIESLKEEFHCLALDLPGHGRSNGSLEDVLGFQGVCQAVMATLDKAEVRRVNVWGYSMGGRIALHFALAFPDRIDRLIVESASPGIENDSLRLARARSDDELASRLLKDGVERFVDHWREQPLFATQMSLPGKRQKRGRELRLRNTAEGLAWALRNLSVGLQEPLQGRLRELRMPTLVLAGELDRAYCAVADSMARSIPGAQLCIIPGAGHAASWEKPAETGMIVREFLLEKERQASTRP